MAGSSDAVYRQWVILRTVPRDPQSRSTGEIHQALLDEGLTVDRRTVQRDLERLSALFPLVSEQQGPGLRWFWLKEGAMQEVPAMNPSTALTFQLARDHLADLFPASLMDVLRPYFERAEAVLGESKLRQWRDRVRIVDSGPSLAAPEVDEEVRDTVYQALLDKRQLRAGYYSRSRDSYGTRRIHPLGLVGRDGVYYLVAAVDDQLGPRHLALHRMDSPEVLEEPAVPPEGFDLDKYLKDEASFSYPRNQKQIHLELLVSGEVAFHMQERPLSEDQWVEAKTNGHYSVTATVPDTEALRWWLLGFGPNIEVAAPDTLRNEVRRLTRQASRLYA